MKYLNIIVYFSSLLFISVISYRTGYFKAADVVLNSKELTRNENFKCNDAIHFGWNK